MSTGLLCYNPYKLPPGYVAVNKLAVDNDKAGRLKALAVLAFYAEITLDPGH